jgi:methylmalonyl-CoA/ethylmalonyl-CoA epimerase
MPDPISASPAVQGFEFHHVGYATEAIARARVPFEAMGYRQEGEPFSDPIQGVRGCFLWGGGPRLELLENLPGRETLTPWLSAGVRMYHMAYEVADLEAGLRWGRDQRAKLTVAPVPAVAFGGRRICFFLLRTGFMIELIEAGA